MIRILVLLLLPVAAFGQTAKELSPAPKVEPVPDAPIPLDVNKYRYYAVEGYTGPVTWVSDGKAVGLKECDKPLTMFGVIHGQVDPGEYPVPAGALIVWGKAEGVTRVQAWGVLDGKAKLLTALVFQVGPRPPPPPPPPPPVTGKLHAYIVVEETSAAWPERGKTMADAKVWSDANGISRRWVDQNVVDATGRPPADMVPWLDRSKGKKLPTVYLVTDKGGILFEGDLPLSSAGFLELLGRYK